jgi:hypothetical protein
VNVAGAVDSALRAIARLLGSSPPPYPSEPAAPGPAPSPPDWHGAAADTALNHSDRLDFTRHQLYAAQRGAAALIAQAGHIIVSARAGMQVVLTGWEHDKAAIAPFGDTPLAQAALLAAGHQRIDQAESVISTAAGQLQTVALGVRALTGQLPSSPPHSPPTPTPPPHLTPPQDPTEFLHWWNSLTPQQKDAAYAADHNIGNHDGMPSADRNHYGKLNLADQLAKAQAAADRAEALTAQHPTWAQDHGGGADPGYHSEPGYAEWKRQYDAATHDARYLPDLKAVDEALKVDPNRMLLLLDTESGSQVRAAIAVGDPDTADHVSVTTPGLNTTVHGAIGSMAREATSVQQEAIRQLRNTPGHQSDTVAAIAWIGYDPPQITGDGLGATVAGAWAVTQDDLARSGARDLARFYDGIKAVHQGPLDLTAIGHSYGSLTTGLALQEPGDHGVDRALFYGSPGIQASTPADLQLQAGQVFTMATPDDRVVQGVYGAKTLAPGIPIVGPYLNEVLGDFGPNPATNPNFTRLETDATTVIESGGSAMVLQQAHGHSDYPRFPDAGGLRTTNYNIAAVIAGTTPIEDK